MAAEAKIKKDNNVDFTSGPIMKNIIVFGLPILLGSIFQQMYNIVDSIVVGNYVGTDALAAVGSASTIAMCLVSLATGLTMGASVVIAQLLGAKRNEDIKKAISTTLFFSLAVAIAITVFGVVLADPIMHWVRVPEELIADSNLYLRIYAGGAVFLMMYNFFSSMLRALGDSRTPLVFLIIATLLNIGGDLFFVLVLNMGVAGVAIATVGAQAISVILCAIHCARKVEYFQFKKGEFRFYRELFKDIVRLSVPSALQFGISSLGFVMVQGLINSFGTSYMAAYTATHKLEGLCHLPMECFSMSLSVFVGQNIGAGQLPRVRQGLRRVLVVLASICVIISAVIYILGPQLIILFAGKEATEVIQIGAKFMRIWAPATFIFSIYMSFSSVLRGAGDSVFVMIASFTDLGLRTIMAYVFALAVQLGYYGVAYAVICGWVGSFLVSFIRYLQGGWKRKAIAGVGQSEQEKA